MQYNEALFGQKIAVYRENNPTGVEPYLYVASQNASVASMYKAGSFQLGEGVPNDVYYWECGELSPYSRLTSLRRSGSSGSYTWDVSTTDSNGRIPIVLTKTDFKLDSNQNPSTTGTRGNRNYSFTSFSASSMKQTANSNPLLYKTNALPSSGAEYGYFNNSLFLIDFNYNELIMEILINGITTDLASYQNDSSHYITSIALYPWVGHGKHPSGAGANNQRYNLRYGLKTSDNTAIAEGGYIGINSFVKMNTPLNVKTADYYGEDQFAISSDLKSGYAIYLIDGSLYGGNSSFSFNFWMDDHWELNDNSSGWRLKKSDAVNQIYTEEDFNYIRKLVAWLGFWFTDGGSYSYTDPDTHQTWNIDRHDSLLGEEANEYSINQIPDKVYMAEIKNGVTTGNFYPLVQDRARNSDQAKWGKDFRDKDGYEGSSFPPTDGKKHSSKSVYTSTISSFGNIYYGDLNMIEYLSQDLSDLVTDEQDPYDPTLFYGQNPVDCIINIKEFPFDITPTLDVLPIPREEIKLGRWVSAVYGQKVRVKTGGEPIARILLHIDPYFKNQGYEFLDYEPYSCYYLYLPFCGTMKIPAALAVGTNIEVRYYADMLAGSCIVHIYIDDMYYASSSGQLAVDVPFSGYKCSDYTRDMLNATYSQKQAIANLTGDIGRIVSAAGSSVQSIGINAKTGSKNPFMFPQLFGGSYSPALGKEIGSGITANNFVDIGAAMRGVGGTIQAGAAIASEVQTIKYNKAILDHSAPEPVKSSLGAGIINWNSPYYVEMLVERPMFLDGFLDNESVYKATVGKACYLPANLGSQKEEGVQNYIEAINCNLSGFPATQPEKVELAKLLADGVFI